MATPPPRRARRRLPALAHPRPPTRAAPTGRRARLPAARVDARLPIRTGAQRRTFRRDRPCHDLLLHRSERADGLPRTVHGAGGRRPKAAAAAAGRSAASTQWQRKVAAPRVKVGADVLPWWPTKGVYLLLEKAVNPPADLVDVDGVGGVVVGGHARTSTAAWRVRVPVRCSHTASSTTIRSRPPTAATGPRRRGGSKTGSNHCSRRPSTLWCPIEWDRYVP